MLDAIEQFATKYQHTAELLTAIGTVGAVITSLAIAFFAARQNRTQLNANVYISIFVPGDDEPSLLTVAITNRGNMPLLIPYGFFNWKLPFKKGYMMAQPLDSRPTPWIAQKQYSVEIAPRTSERFFLSDEVTLRSEVKRMRGQYSSIGRLRFRFIRALIWTDDGMKFRAKLSKDIADMWRNG